MTLGLAYWVLMLVWLVFGVALHFGYAASVSPLVGTVLLFVLFGLLGWQVFGPPLRK